MKHSLFRASAWLTIGTTASRLLPLVLLYATLRASNPSQYGSYALAAGIVALFYVVAEGGMLLVVTSTTLTHQQARGLAARGLRHGAALYALAILVAVPFALRDGFETVVALTAASGIPILTVGIGAVNIGKLQYSGQYRTLAVTQLVASLVSITVGFVCLWGGLGVLSLVAQAVLNDSLSHAGATFVRSGRIVPDTRATVPSETSSRLRSAVTSNFAGALGRRTDDLFVGGLLGANALGQYALGYRVLTTLTQLTLHSFERVAVSTLAEVRDSAPETSKKVLKSLQRRVTLTTAPLFVASGVASYLLIPLILGGAWVEAATCSAILCFAGAVQSVNNLTFSALFLLASPQVSLRFQIAQIGLLLTPTIAGACFGVEFAATGYLIGTSLAAGLAAMTKHKWLGRPTQSNRFEARIDG